MIREKLIFKLPQPGATTPKVCPVEALAFISAHEAATGLSMNDIQKEAICELVRNLQGDGTTNSTDIWTNLVSRDARMWIFAPTDNTTISYVGCNVDLVTATTKGTFNNFVGGDLTVNGLTGGTGKWFDSDKSPSNYALDDVGIFVNVQSFVTGGVLSGVQDPSATNRHILQATATAIGISINNSGTDFRFTSSSAGATHFYGGQRISSTQVEQIKDGVILNTATRNSTARSTRSQYFMARDANGTLDLETSSTCNVFIQGIQSLNANGMADLNEAIVRYNDNIITGGR